MIIDNAGTYTLKYTATDECGNSTTVDRELEVKKKVPIYGIKSTATKVSTCERIGASALFVDPIPQRSNGSGGWVGGSSPFDDIMPWSGMEIVEDAMAGTLVKIPKFYYRLAISEPTSDVAQDITLEIAPEYVEGFNVSPAHADRGDGVGERDVVYVGRYFCNSAYASKTGSTIKANESLDSFRASIHSKGTDIWQYDFAMHCTICMLYLVEFANFDVKSTIGVGYQYTQYTGGTNSMTYHTGKTSQNINDTGKTQYRHIEDLWGGISQLCDGIRFDNRDVYAFNNPSEYSSAQGGVNIGSRTLISGIGYGSIFMRNNIDGFEYVLLPSGCNQRPSRTNDAYVTNSTGTVLATGYQQNDGGLFTHDSQHDGSYSTWFIGSRLMKLPSA